MSEIPAQNTTAPTSIDMSRARVRITVSDRPRRQPWHCALIAGNNEKTWWTETYGDRDSAEGAVMWLGRFFSPVNMASYYVHHHTHGQASPYAGNLDVWLDDQELGAKYAIPVEYVDQRTPGGS